MDDVLTTAPQRAARWRGGAAPQYSIPTVDAVDDPLAVVLPGDTPDLQRTPAPVIE